MILFLEDITKNRFIKMPVGFLKEWIKESIMLLKKSDE
jgi:hypothetical protein